MPQTAKHLLAVLSTAFTVSTSAQPSEPVEPKAKPTTLKPLSGEYYAFKFKEEVVAFCNKAVAGKKSGEIAGYECLSPTGLTPGSKNMPGTSIAKDSPYQFAGDGKWIHETTGHIIQLYNATKPVGPSMNALKPE